MSGGREIQDLLAMRDALVELSGALHEWLFLQSALEGTLPTREVEELLQALGEIKREPGKTN